MAQAEVDGGWLCMVHCLRNGHVVFGRRDNSFDQSGRNASEEGSHDRALQTTRQLLEDQGEGLADGATSFKMSMKEKCRGSHEGDVDLGILIVRRNATNVSAPVNIELS